MKWESHIKVKEKKISLEIFIHHAVLDGLRNMNGTNALFIV
jgi:hypothetical protein